MQWGQHLQVLVGLLLVALALTLQAQQFCGLARVGPGQALAEQAGILAVAGEQAGGAEDADGTLALVQALASGGGQLLEVAQADVHTHHTKHAAVLDHRERQGGDQGLLARCIVEVRVQQARLERLPGAVEPAVEGAAVEHGRGIADHPLGHGQGAQLAIALGPVGGEAALFIAAGFGAIGKERIAAVQGIRLEYQVEAEQLRVGLQRILHLLVELLTEGLGVQLQLLRLAALLQHLTGEVQAVLVGGHEVTLDGQRLYPALPLHALTGGGFQHLRAVRLDQGGAGVHAIERDADEHGDYGQQAEAGQQGDLPLDGKSVEGHGRRSFLRRFGGRAPAVGALMYGGVNRLQLESGWISERYCPGVEPVHFLKAL
ncbi:hypothetical protein D9M69_450300 [compost metagenome]